MRKTVRKTVLPLVICAYLVLALSSMIFAGERKETLPVREINSTAPSTASESRKPVGYLLTEKGGRLVVKDENTGEIIRKTDTLVSILPEKDRKMLEKGIRAETAGELRRLLEDFCS